MISTVTERTGLGPLEVAVLEGLAAGGLGGGGAVPGRPHRKVAKTLSIIEAQFEFARTYAYEALLDLARPWKVLLRLVDFHGNYGSKDFVAADPSFVEARLSPAGALALASERSEIGPLPVGLINGSIYSGGTRPPFDPSAIVTALLRLCDDPTLDDESLCELAGAPRFPADVTYRAIWHR